MDLVNIGVNESQVKFGFNYNAKSNNIDNVRIYFRESCDNVVVAIFDWCV